MRRKCTTSEKMITFVTFKDYTKRMKAAASRLFSSEYTNLSGSVPPCGTCNASAMLGRALDSGKGGAAFFTSVKLSNFLPMLRSSRATTVAPSPMPGHLDAARSAGVVYQLRYGSYIIGEFDTYGAAVRYSGYLPAGIYEVRRVQCDGEFRIFDPTTDYWRRFYNKAIPTWDAERLIQTSASHAGADNEFFNPTTTGHDTHE